MSSPYSHAEGFGRVPMDSGLGIAQSLLVLIPKGEGFPALGE